MEIPDHVRRYWETRLNEEREKAHIVGSEFDPAQGKTLGSDDSGWTYGVRCAAGKSQGAGSSFIYKGRDEDDFIGKHGGGLVFRRDEDKRDGLGSAIGAVYTDLWALVRPHDCTSFVKHSPGLTPAQHIEKQAKRNRVLRASEIVVLLRGLIALADDLAKQISKIWPFGP